MTDPIENNLKAFEDADECQKTYRDLTLRLYMNSFSQVLPFTNHNMPRGWMRTHRVLTGIIH